MPLARPAHYEAADVRVDKVIVGPFENNAYVIRCAHTGDAVLVDAANEHELLIPLCRQLGVRRVLTTHGHWDHVQAVTAARNAGIDVGIAQGDADMLKSYDFVIHDEDVFEVGRLRISTIHNPGHTPGSVSFLLNDHPLLFTGDTLFPGGPGNTSAHAQASFDQIIESIDRRLFTLDPGLRVLPGHGLDTTIAAERPSLDAWIERGW